MRDRPARLTGILGAPSLLENPAKSKFIFSNALPRSPPLASSLPAPCDVPPADSPDAQPHLRLCELPVGAHALIVGVDTAADPGGRLEELGFRPGTRVQLLRRAPLGDPAVYALRGTRFCVRRSEARAVRVRALPDEAVASNGTGGSDEAGGTAS